ncbi:hypothetical protein AURANDRAFT_14498, partial [Aureococcus anophagefferens]
EATVLAKLHHPNIVHFYGVVMHAQHVFVVTEYVPRSLTKHLDLVKAGGGLELRGPYCDLALGVAQGVAFLHSRRTAHRDIKPSNVLVDPPALAKLCDFGLSKSADAKAMVTCTTGVGTPAPGADFASPTDVFAYGMLLVSLWNCLPPFATSDDDVPPPFVVMSKIANGERPTLPPGMPRRLAAVVEDCWAQDPAARPTM